MKKCIGPVIFALVFMIAFSSVVFAFDDLSKGSKGDNVAKLQTRMNELGYSVGKADGAFGSKTKKAVEEFQQNNGLEVTGTVDEATYNAVFSETAVRSEGSDGDESVSDLQEFKSVMMKSVASQINQATDLTTTDNDRAILAALLTLEFANQQPDFKIDYSLPMYVCKTGTIASVAVGGEKDYAVILFQSKPLSTSYGLFHTTDYKKVKAALMMSSESVWQVDLGLYNEKLEALIGQL